MSNQTLDTVLIVDDDPVLLRMVENHFGQYGDIFHSVLASNAEEARQVLESREVAVLVTDLAMPEVSKGLELLDFTHQHHPEIPCIVITGIKQKNITDSLLDEVDLLFLKPLNMDELVNAITDTLEKRFFKGIMTGVPVAALLQMLSMERKTCLLEVRAPNRGKGILYLSEGELYRAKIDQFEGEEAAYEMIPMTDATLQFQFLPKRKISRTIEADLMALTLEAMRRADETETLVLD